ncbi:hypothetical protein [Streptomyces mirabilis]|uniref:hypothetical protein n=1 Tax=Streptomyces mirabilis TaxID=68239 RepID=UPI00368FB1C6
MHRGLALLGTAVAATVLAVGTAQAYATQSGQTHVDHCVNTVSGGTQGNYFIADAWGGAGCNASYVELVYIDKSGTERYKKVSSTVVSGPNATIKLANSSYKSILEVIGSSDSIQNHNTGGVYLYF